jgi:ABC-type multidrug transport system permease subunit
MTISYLLQRSIIIMKQTLPDKIINHLFWVILNTVIFNYIMPQAPSIGINAEYGIFIALSMPASAAFFGAINCMYGLLYDVTTEGSNLRYELTLPIPQYLIFVKYGVEIGIQTFIAASTLFPVIYLLLINQLPFYPLGIIKFYIALLATSIFGGFFSVFIVSVAQDMFQGLDNVWIRIVFPVWFLGCFQFSWNDLYTINTWVAYLDLLNPLTYALEASRASIIPSGSVLNFWVCIAALLIFASIFGYIGIHRLMKRMDCL